MSLVAPLLRLVAATGRRATGTCAPPGDRFHPTGRPRSRSADQVDGRISCGPRESPAGQSPGEKFWPTHGLALQIDRTHRREDGIGLECIVITINKIHICSCFFHRRDASQNNTRLVPATIRRIGLSLVLRNPRFRGPQSRGQRFSPQTARTLASRPSAISRP
jgi:hypothetical protein